MLSIWNGGICQATFQLPGDQVDLFAETLRHTAPAPSPGHAPTAPSQEVFRTGQRDTQPTIA